MLREQHQAAAPTCIVFAIGFAPIVMDTSAPRSSTVRWSGAACAPTLAVSGYTCPGGAEAAGAFTGAEMVRVKRVGARDALPECDGAR